MAHPYRIGDPGDLGGAARLAAVAVARTTPAPRPPRRPTPRPSAAEPAPHCPAAQRDWRSPTGLPRRAPPPSAPPPAASWTPCRAHRRRSPDRRRETARPGGPARPAAHGGTATSGPPSRDTTTRAPGGSVAPGVNASSASSARPPRAGRRRGRRDHHHRPVAVGNVEHRRRRLEVQRPDDDGLGGPVRSGHLEGGQRGDQAAQRTGIARRAVRSRPAPRRAAGRPRAPTGRSARASPRRAADRAAPMPGASPLPTGGSPFDGRYSGCGLSSTHGTPSSSAASPPHAVITSDTTRSGASSSSCGRVEHGHPCGPPVELGAGVGVVVAVGRVEAERARPRRRPAPRAVSSHSAPVSRVGVVTGGLELQAQRERGKRVPGVGSGDHRDAHPPTLPQPRESRRCEATEPKARLAVMTEQTIHRAAAPTTHCGRDLPLRAAGPGLRHRDALLADDVV